MAEHNERGLFHHHGHKKPEEDVVVETTSIHSSATVVDCKPVDAKYEKHQAKKDPEHAHKHHIGEAIAGAAEIGSGAYAVHEHHDKKDAEKEAKHHHFGH